MKPSIDSLEILRFRKDDAGDVALGPGTLLRVPERFRAIRRLGGGASEVLAALDRVTQSIVALKVDLSPGSSLGQVSREGAVLARLDHPGIVKFVAQGDEGDLCWLATECLEGVSLDVVMREHRPLPWPWIRTALIQVLDALQYAHESGIIHGDVKPSNCFCSGFVAVAGPMRLKLLDFGLARDTSEPSVGEGSGFGGSAAYLAPERSAGGQATEAGDLYSVGVMAHELLLGHLPFGAGGSQTVLWLQQHGGISSLVGRAELVDIPPSALRALDKALDKSPERRPSSARALRNGLLEAKGDEADRSRRRWIPSARLDSREQTLLRLAEHVQRIWVDDYLNETRMGFVDVRQVYRWLSTNVGWSEVSALLPVFERAGGHLVVLGEPGFGKTVAVLKLCRALLDLRRRSDSQGCVPVVIPLSTWRGSAQDVSRWLVNELRTRYSVLRRQGRELLRSKRLVLLLDGLDEVPLGVRQGCVNAIHGLVRGGGFAGVVVTCRTREYNEILAPLAGLAHVDLQRLDIFEVQQRVKRQGLRALAAALETNTRLAELATIPLMLRLLQGVSREDAFPHWVQSGSISADGLLDRFLEGPLKAVGDARRVARLIGLARLAVVEGQGVVRCEALQPRMLRATWTRVAYVLFSRLLVSGVACFGPLLAVIFSPFPNGGLDTTPAFAIELSLKSTLVSGGLFGMVALLQTSFSSLRSVTGWLNGLAGVLALVGAAAWVGIGRPPAAAVMALEATLLSLIVLWGARPGVSSVHDDVALDRDLGFRRPSVQGSVCACLFGGLWAVFGYFGSRSWTAAMHMGVSFAVVGFLLAGMKTRRDTIAIVWNGAFWRALRGAHLAAGLTIAVVTAAFGPSFGMGYSAFVALTFGAVVLLWVGGTDAIYYVIMRLLLAAEGTVPLRTRELMERAVSARIMKRVGGGYAFLHSELAARLLLRRMTRSDT